MQIAIFLYDGFTALDAVGPYEVLGGLPGATVLFAAEKTGPVTADTGALSLVAQASLDDVPRPDIVLVPGSSRSTAAQMSSIPVREWLRSAESAQAGRRRSAPAHWS